MPKSTTSTSKLVPKLVFVKVTCTEKKSFTKNCYCQG